MTLVDAFTDAEGILRTWLNSLTSTLVGAGHPLPLGAHLTAIRMREPGRGPYVLLSRISGDDDWLADAASDTARISASIFGWTKDETATGAIAYANTLRQIPVLKPVVGSSRIVAVDAINGPTLINAPGEGTQYLVDCSLYLVPAS